MGVASDTLSAINKSQWEDYKQRYIPIENELMDAYDNPELRQERMAAVTNDAATASDNAQRMTSLSLSRYGQADTSAGDARASQLTKASNIVDARNVNRQQMNSRDQLLISGGLTSRGV